MKPSTATGMKSAAPSVRRSGQGRVTPKMPYRKWPIWYASSARLRTRTRSTAASAPGGGAWRAPARCRRWPRAARSGSWHPPARSVARWPAREVPGMTDVPTAVWRLDESAAQCHIAASSRAPNDPPILNFGSHFGALRRLGACAHRFAGQRGHRLGRAGPAIGDPSCPVLHHPGAAARRSTTCRRAGRRARSGACPRNPEPLR